MAVHTFSAYDKSERIEYKDCVIRTFERNGYDDSDWYAVCWDEAQGKVVEIEYDTTRFGSNGSYARVDCTQENLRKAYRYFYNRARSYYDNTYNIAQAQEIHKHDKVVVVRGKKVTIGTTGKVFWVGEVYNKYTYRNEARVGINSNGESYFLPENYVEPVDWEDRLITGKKRKLWIRNKALELLHKRETSLMPLKIAFKYYPKESE